MIREMKPKDFDSIIDIMKTNAKEAGDGIGKFDEGKLNNLLKNLVINLGYNIFVNETDYKITGFVVCQAMENAWNNKNEGTIIFFYILPEHRNGFTAKNLLARAEQWFRELDCEYYVADVRAWLGDYTTNDQFVEQGHSFFSKMMTTCGYCYVKEIL